MVARPRSAAASMAAADATGAARGAARFALPLLGPVVAAALVCCHGCCHVCAATAALGVTGLLMHLAIRGGNFMICFLVMLCFVYLSHAFIPGAFEACLDPDGCGFISENRNCFYLLHPVVFFLRQVRQNLVSGLLFVVVNPAYPSAIIFARASVAAQRAVATIDEHLECRVDLRWLV